MSIFLFFLKRLPPFHSFPEYASELRLVLPLQCRVVDAEPALVSNLQVQLLPPVIHTDFRKQEGLSKGAYNGRLLYGFGTFGENSKVL